MKYVVHDKKYNFKYAFDTKNGTYVRTGILDENGKDTGIDPFMASFPHLIDEYVDRIRAAPRIQIVVRNPNHSRAFTGRIQTQKIGGADMNWRVIHYGACVRKLLKSV